jgi:hypothetical protein
MAQDGAKKINFRRGVELPSDLPRMMITPASTGHARRSPQIGAFVFLLGRFVDTNGGPICQPRVDIVLPPCNPTVTKSNWWWERTILHFAAQMIATIADALPWAELIEIQNAHLLFPRFKTALTDTTHLCRYRGGGDAFNKIRPVNRPMPESGDS